MLNELAYFILYYFIIIKIIHVLTDIYDRVDYEFSFTSLVTLIASYMYLLTINQQPIMTYFCFCYMYLMAEESKDSYIMISIMTIVLYNISA